MSSVLTGIQPQRAFDEAFRRIERLEQGITTPGYTGGSSGSGDNEFETIVLGPPGSQVTLSVAVISPPVNIIATPGAFGPRSFVDVSWDAAINAVSYQAELATNVGGTRAIVDQATGVPRNVRFDNLDRSKSYSVRVASLNRLGITGAFSAWVDFSPLVDPLLPATVTGLAVFRGATSLIATWNASTDADVANGNGLYKVQRATNNTFTTDLDEKLTSATVISFNGITSEQTWYVRVAAIDSSGNQSAAWSTIVSTTAGGITGTMVLPSTIPSDKLTLGPPGNNMVANGSFDGTTYMGPEGHLFPESWGYLDTMPAGLNITVMGSTAKYLRIVPSATNPARVYGKGFAVMAGQTYFYSFKYRPETTVASGVYIQAVIKSVLNEYRYLNVVEDIVLVNNAGGTANVWVTVEGQFTPTQSGFCMMALISNTNGPALNFDDIVISKPATNAAIGNNVITAAKVAANTLTANEIAANAITASELSATAITASHIAANLIVGTHIASGSIVTAHMTAGTIDGDRITANTIAVSKLLADSILASNINIGAGGQFKVGNPPSGAGGVFNTQGLSVYNAAGTRTIFLNFGDGSGTFTGTVSGSTITGGTITGAVYQTAASGARIKIDTVLEGTGSGQYSRASFITTRADNAPASLIAYYDSTAGYSFLQIRGPQYGSTVGIPLIRVGSGVANTSDKIELLASRVQASATIIDLVGTVIHGPHNYENYDGTVLAKKNQNGDWTYRSFRTVGTDVSAGIAFHAQELGSAAIFHYRHDLGAFLANNSADSAGLFIYCDGIIDNSAARLKRSIEDMPSVGNFRQIRPRTFKLNDYPACASCDLAGKINAACQACGGTGDARSVISKERANRTRYGLVAEEIATVFPEVVQKDQTGSPAGIEYSQLVAILLKVCQELDARLVALEGRRP